MEEASLCRRQVCAGDKFVEEMRKTTKIAGSREAETKSRMYTKLPCKYWVKVISEWGSGETSLTTLQNVFGF